MADNSNAPPDHLDFHPCDTPRGMTYFKLRELTDQQKSQLFDHKLEVVRDNQRYLRDHPEVRTVVDVLLNAVLRARPQVRLRMFLAKYFVENYDEIKALMEQFSGSQEEPSEPEEWAAPEDEEQESEDLDTLSDESRSSSLLCVIDDAEAPLGYPSMVRGTQLPLVVDDERTTSWGVVRDIVREVSEDWERMVRDVPDDDDELGFSMSFPQEIQ